VRGRRAVALAEPPIVRRRRGGHRGGPTVASAALPLVAVCDRRKPAPVAGGSRERLSRLRRSGNRRRGGVDRRAGYIREPHRSVGRDGENAFLRCELQDLLAGQLGGDTADRGELPAEPFGLAGI